MLENDIFEQWLDDEAQRVLARLKANQPLNQDDKLVIVLKGQMNHFHHLDVDLREEIAESRIDMDKRFEAMDKRFEAIDQRFEIIDQRFETITMEIKHLYQAINTQTWKMIGAIGLIAVLLKLIDQF
uniref:Haemolysin XhlA n=1 Tax=Candidatus Kentrum sp. TUN TaxID=2126343 RepID=A0A451ANB8_9GAMM|nr:MAG: hypothetical protein BECKTUN1418F_GA0071002_11591 [Candidatus Kentron sp. TUN]VFK67546.1 MAG: hypothetical protein BECKTUN1418E_GA0071001_11541 [Candidatus Kentron sp. TUN]